MAVREKMAGGFQINAVRANNPELLSRLSITALHVTHVRCIIQFNPQTSPFNPNSSRMNTHTNMDLILPIFIKINNKKAFLLEFFDKGLNYPTLYNNKLKI